MFRQTTVKVVFRDGTAASYIGRLSLYMPGTYIVRKGFRTVAAFPYSIVKTVAVVPSRKMTPVNIKQKAGF